MPNVNNKSTEFSGEPFYIGLDVHKKSWTVTVRAMNLEVAHFTQQPDVKGLHSYLNKKFPGAKFHSAYEAGFCGTSIHTALIGAGIENIIIHPADLPQTDKQKKNKNDLHDSRAIARYLEKHLLKGIYVMPVEQQERRALFRCREDQVGEVTRCTNRLRGMLNYFGVEVPRHLGGTGHISKNFLAWIGNLELNTPEGTDSLRYYLEDLKYKRQQLLELTWKLKKTAQEHYGEQFEALLTVPGIGPITAIALLLETGDLGRFADPDQYCSYLGVVPSERSSGEQVHSNGLQPRCNRHLRPLLIEAAWAAVRRSPELLAYFKKYAAKDSKKAIVKVARKLALIAKAVAIGKKPYVPGSQHLQNPLQAEACEGNFSVIQDSE